MRRLDLRGPGGRRSLVLRSFVKHFFVRHAEGLLTREATVLRLLGETDVPTATLAVVEATAQYCRHLSLFVSLLPGTVRLGDRGVLMTALNSWPGSWCGSFRPLCLSCFPWERGLPVTGYLTLRAMSPRSSTARLRQQSGQGAVLAGDPLELLVGLASDLLPWGTREPASYRWASVMSKVDRMALRGRTCPTGPW